MSEIPNQRELLQKYVVTDTLGERAVFTERIDFSRALIEQTPIPPDVTGRVIDAALDPTSLQSHWPCRLFGVEVPAERDTGGVRVTQYMFVKSEENPALVLGPQRERLLAMAARLLEVTTEEQEAMSGQFTLKNTDEYVAADDVIRKLAARHGRRNSTAVLNLMWLSEPWARQPIGGAALAVAHCDLLPAGEHDPLFRTLYRPWQVVMGDS